MYNTIILGVCFGGGVEIKAEKNILAENSRLRCDKVVELYQHGIINTILCTGGVFISHQTTPVSILMKGYLVDRGVKASDVYTEELSVDTIENIQFSIELLQKLSLNITHIILISEKNHLKRIALSWKAYAEKYSFQQGLLFEIQSVDYELTEDERKFEHEVLAYLQNDPFGLSETFEALRRERRKNSQQ